jgi:hypothetical protein
MHPFSHFLHNIHLTLQFLLFQLDQQGKPLSGRKVIAFVPATDFQIPQRPGDEALPYSWAFSDGLVQDKGATLSNFVVTTDVNGVATFTSLTITGFTHRSITLAFFCEGAMLVLSEQTNRRSINEPTLIRTQASVENTGIAEQDVRQLVSMIGISQMPGGAPPAYFPVTFTPWNLRLTLSGSASAWTRSNPLIVTELISIPSTLSITLQAQSGPIQNRVVFALVAGTVENGIEVPFSTQFSRDSSTLYKSLYNPICTKSDSAGVVSCPQLKFSSSGRVGIYVVVFVSDGIFGPKIYVEVRSSVTQALLYLPGSLPKYRPPQLSSQPPLIYNFLPYQKFDSTLLPYVYITNAIGQPVEGKTVELYDINEYSTFRTVCTPSDANGFAFIKSLTIQPSGKGISNLANETTLVNRNMRLKIKVDDFFPFSPLVPQARVWDPYEALARYLNYVNYDERFFSVSEWKEFFPPIAARVQWLQIPPVNFSTYQQLVASVRVYDVFNSPIENITVCPVVTPELFNPGLFSTSEFNRYIETDFFENFADGFNLSCAVTDASGVASWQEWPEEILLRFTVQSEGFRGRLKMVAFNRADRFSNNSFAQDLIELFMSTQYWPTPIWIPQIESDSVRFTVINPCNNRLNTVIYPPAQLETGDRFRVIFQSDNCQDPSYQLYSGGVTILVPFLFTNPTTAVGTVPFVVNASGGNDLKIDCETNGTCIGDYVLRQNCGGDFKVIFRDIVSLVYTEVYTVSTSIPIQSIQIVVQPSSRFSLTLPFQVQPRVRVTNSNGVPVRGLYVAARVRESSYGPGKRPVLAGIFTSPSDANGYANFTDLAFLYAEQDATYQLEFYYGNNNTDGFIAVTSAPTISLRVVNSATLKLLYQPIKAVFGFPVVGYTSELFNLDDITTALGSSASGAFSSLVSGGGINAITDLKSQASRALSSRPISVSISVSQQTEITNTRASSPSSNYTTAVVVSAITRDGIQAKLVGNIALPILTVVNSSEGTAKYEHVATFPSLTFVSGPPTFYSLVFSLEGADSIDDAVVVSDSFPVGAASLSVEIV